MTFVLPLHVILLYSVIHKQIDVDVIRWSKYNGETDNSTAIWHQGTICGYTIIMFTSLMIQSEKIHAVWLYMYVNKYMGCV